MIGTQHIPRVLTGIGLITLLTITLTQGRMALLTGLLVVTCLALWEFYRLFWSGKEKIFERLFGLFCGSALIYAASWQHPQLTLVCLSIIALLFAILFLILWARNTSTKLENIGILLFGIAYIPLLLIPVFTFTTVEIILLLIATGSSDTIAYFAGLRYGRHKIWPAVSPKKSIEGSLAGLLACILATSLMGLFFGFAPWYQFAALGFCLNVAAQLGDFFESAIKRVNNIKDSGSLLPGHGGVLDRVDSLLFLIPTYALVKNFTTFF